MKAETIPGFDCLEFQWKAQSDLYEKTKDMTVEEQIAFFREAAATGPFADLVKAIDAGKTATSQGVDAAHAGPPQATIARRHNKPEDRRP